MPDVGCAGLLVEDTFCGPLAALPAEGALVVLEDMPVRAGGCAANVAIDLAKQGIAVDVAGCVGSDGAAGVLLKAFAAHDVCCSRVVSLDGWRTSKTVILLLDGQDRRYLHVAGANRAFSVGHIAREWVAQLKVFYVGGLFALPNVDIRELAELLEFCRRSDVLTVIDVAVPQDVRGMAQLTPLLPLVDVFLPNEDEARAFTGLTDVFDQLRALRKAGASTVIITRGQLGCVAARAGMTWTCGSYQMDVVDPSGSGDAFTSGIIRGLLMDWDLPQALRYASAIGASATRAAGTTDSVFSAAEATAFMTQYPLAVTQTASSGT
jgi:sugar/nucleoside kinase (ribokinase family)